MTGPVSNADLAQLPNTFCGHKFIFIFQDNTLAGDLARL